MKYIFTSCFIFAILLMPYISQAQSINIACVDLNKVVFESDEGREIHKIMAAEQERMKKDIDAKQDELQKLKDAIEKQGGTITREALAEKERQYQSKLTDYQRLTDDYQSELQQKNDEYVQKVLKELEGIVKAIGEKEKYSVILQENQGGILFSAPSVDITDKVIAAFNEAAKNKTPAPSATKK